ncbi:hypothetical protein [Pseudomonas phage pPA-3099-2aT.3]|nr:hypothetical protein [Pseudomonas phage pPA-3099-2aT.3]
MLYCIEEPRIMRARARSARPGAGNAELISHEPRAWC